MIEKYPVSYPAFGGEEERTLYLYLPADYMEDLEARYPVLYMFDGHNVFFDEDATFGKSWGLGEYLDYSRVPLIVAALECNQNPDDARIIEYAPYDFTVPARFHKDLPRRQRKPMDVHGFGKETMEWFTQVLKPMIDSELRTMPEREYTFLMGSSMGGLMSIYGLLEFNDVFGKACSLSPCMDFWAPQLLEHMKKAQVQPNTALYIDYGMQEPDYRAAVERLAPVTAAALRKGISLTYRTIPGGTHSEASWENQLEFCIDFLMYGII